MKSVALIVVSMIGLWSCGEVLSSALAQSTQTSTVTLYSVNKYPGERRKSCLNFQTAQSAPCDLRYGALYAGDELDWFESSAAQGNRSVIKDLDNRTWTSEFEVPVVEPLPKLKPGERRQISIDTSGADGADGAPGAPGAPGKNGADADGVVRSQPAPVPAPAGPIFATPSRPKHDGKPKVDPMFVKAIAGHMYVIHVVDDTRDFYALFRVEALQRGDQVEVSWRLIPEPSKSIQ
jgi:hypothetical protein